MISFDEVSAYVVGKGPVGIIFIHDIFGLPSGMNKLICDSLSAKIPNSTVFAPDFYNGNLICGDDPLPERGGSLIWKVIWPIISCKICGYLQQYSWDNSSEEVFNKVTSYMIKEYDIKKFIPLGVCWGAYVGWKACGFAQHKDMIVGKSCAYSNKYAVLFES